MNVFCANMMDLNRRADAIGYAYPTRISSWKTVGPAFYSRNRALRVSLISGKHTHTTQRRAARLGKNENTGYLGKFELQINNEYILSISPTLHGPYLALFLFIIFLKLEFKCKILYFFCHCFDCFLPPKADPGLEFCTDWPTR